MVALDPARVHMHIVPQMRQGMELRHDVPQLLASGRRLHRQSVGSQKPALDVPGELLPLGVGEETPG